MAWRGLMASKKKTNNLNSMLDDLSDAGEQSDDVALDDVMETIGQRSFGPLLLIPGLVVLSPIAGIPGVGAASGVVVILIAGQLLIGCDSFWLPKFIRERTVARERLDKSIKKLRPVARIVDKLLRPRLEWLTREPATYGVAATCVLLALMLPVLDMVPFTSLVPAGAITAFALALISHDGAVAIGAFVLSVASLFVVGTIIL
jgi:hypothetical protein